MIDYAEPTRFASDGEQIAAAGQPSEEQLAVLAEAGFATVIDLRGEREQRGYDEKAAVEALGMRYVPLPVSGASGVSFDTARDLDALLQGIDGPVLLHCGSGNRVGALLALRAHLNGESTEDALDLGDRAGLTRLRPLVVETLEAADVEAGATAESAP